MMKRLKLPTVGSLHAHINDIHHRAINNSIDKYRVSITQSIYKIAQKAVILMIIKALKFSKIHFVSKLYTPLHILSRPCGELKSISGPMETIPNGLTAR